MSSSALVLVNKALRMTGSYSQLSSISGSPGGIGERIIEMLNLVIADIESKANWPELRSNDQFTGDGSTSTFTLSGYPAGPVSVWIDGYDRLEELTASQFDEALATDLYSRSNWFQRGASGSVGTIQIYPTPANGDVINVSAYTRATRLDADTPSGTTEFDDEILVYGACMHMDLYDQVNRNYATLFMNLLSQRVLSYYSNMSIAISTESYR